MNYGIEPPKCTEDPNIHMMAQQQTMFSFCPPVAHVSQQYAVVPPPFVHQMSMPIGHHPFGIRPMVAPPQQHQHHHGISTMLCGTTAFDRRDDPIDNDSGLGLTDQSGKGDSENTSASSSDGTAANLGQEQCVETASHATNTATPAATVVSFRPFIRSVFEEGVQQFRDLETMVYSETPARLALLGNMSKYPITLAEIVRRVSPPECLNTSFLSGILRRAKTKDGGKLFRMELQRFNCGVDLQSGRRKAGAITTFTALCERESIQLASDFDKLAKTHFPDKELAFELCRRTRVNVWEKHKYKQLLIKFQSVGKIVRHAVHLMERAIEQETGEIPGQSTELVVQQQQPTNDTNGTAALEEDELMSKFKRFARMSHCFGNRGMLCAWQCLLSVIGNCEVTLLQHISTSSQGPLKEVTQNNELLAADFPGDLTIFQQQSGKENQCGDAGGSGSSNWVS